VTFNNQVKAIAYSGLKLRKYLTDCLSIWHSGRDYEVLEVDN